LFAVLALATPEPLLYETKCIVHYIFAKAQDAFNIHADLHLSEAKQQGISFSKKRC